MQSFFAKTFGGLDASYYGRHFVFGVLISAFMLWTVSKRPLGLYEYPGDIALVVVNTLLYPYARFVYESVVEFIMGRNVFFMNAFLMLGIKVMTMTMCWVTSIIIAPIGLAYLYWHHSRSTAR
ncbi:hypothetical protein KDX38_23140 [Pseudomonas sp. CDFA 602]|uniref:hypothetical protein n=1 Tax=Pseudomonas californiensis TaxID=2829823 RepID=UPI001E618C42|nr:hypothetical protein [Pseudomonas californiensis]MCD5996488.1 hypothetical protein [Pseudomonas californiensis]MCD6002087.1 hypothetical protein [Pseudomonas californiensis]